MKWGMAATKQKMCSLYVCQLITTLQRRFGKDKASCINLAVIQAGKTNLQGMALSSHCSFLRKLTLDIWAQFRKCLIFFLSLLSIREFLNSIQYLTFKRHDECCRQFRVITDKQKYIFYIYTWMIVLHAHYPAFLHAHQRVYHCRYRGFLGLREGCNSFLMYLEKFIKVHCRISHAHWLVHSSVNEEIPIKI